MAWWLLVNTSIFQLSELRPPTFRVFHIFFFLESSYFSRKQQKRYNRTCFKDLMLLHSHPITWGVACFEFWPQEKYFPNLKNKNILTFIKRNFFVRTQQRKKNFPELPIWPKIDNTCWKLGWDTLFYYIYSVQ